MGQPFKPFKPFKLFKFFVNARKKAPKALDEPRRIVYNTRVYPYSSALCFVRRRKDVPYG